jgi:outer membrane receptor protein involved in Fe transport
LRDAQNNYEFQNYTSISHGNHLIKFGARIRALDVSNIATPNFNGAFEFSPVVGSGGQVLSALSVYQNALQQGCSQSGSTSCPSQVTISTGQPRLQFNLIDAGLYAEDEWRARPNLSLTYGLRFESQERYSVIHADFARRGLGWHGALGAPARVPQNRARGFWDVL